MTKKKSKDSFAEDIIADIVPVRKVKPWYELIPNDVLQKLLPLKARLRKGELFDPAGKPVSKNALAKAISKNLRDHKIATIGTQGIVAWLNKN